MEGVEGLMKGLKLSEEEKKGVKIRLSVKEKGKASEAQAVGKVISEKLAHPDAIALSLGRVWCPIKGISCKEIGVNQFLITFHQESGKRKAMEDGPWMFDKDLVVVEEYVPSRRPEDYLFDNIPIWVRVFNLPLGMMNAESAEDIGNIVGKYVEADTGADGSAIGRFLRVKIRMQIDKPLMRGFTLNDEEGIEEAQRRGKGAMMNEEEEEEGSWCRFEYEFLPDFCYTCGLIGHGEKDCTTKLGKGEKAQFGRWLRADMLQRRGNMEDRAWRNNGRSGSGSRSYGYSRSGGRTGSGSDSLSWRKNDSRSSGGGGDGKGERGEEDTSPVKALPAPKSGGSKKKLDLEGGPAMIACKENEGKEQAGKGTEEGVENTKNTNQGGRRYRKKHRDRPISDGAKGSDSTVGQKREWTGGEDAEEEGVLAGKKGRVEEGRKETEVVVNGGEETTTQIPSAGLQEQPRRDQ